MIPTGTPILHVPTSAPPSSSSSLPPPVDAHIGGPSEPGVQDVDASQGVRPADGVPQRRVVVQPQSLPEPVYGVDHHGRLPASLVPGGLRKRESGSTTQQSDALLR